MSKSKTQRNWIIASAIAIIAFYAIITVSYFLGSGSSWMGSLILLFFLALASKNF